MKFTFKRIFVALLLIIALCAFSLFVLKLAELYLPINQLTHECKPVGIDLFKEDDDPQSNSTTTEHEFCPSGQQAEFKESWDRIVSNTAIPLAILSIMASIPVGTVLLYRLLRKKIVNVS